MFKRRMEKVSSDEQSLELVIQKQQKRLKKGDSAQIAIVSQKKAQLSSQQKQTVMKEVQKWEILPEGIKVRMGSEIRSLVHAHLSSPRAPLCLKYNPLIPAMPVLDLQNPCFLVLCGHSGSGKSKFIQAQCRQQNYELLDKTHEELRNIKEIVQS